MADISRIRVDSTTYDLKDARLPAYTNTQATFLRDDGTWSTAGGDTPVENGTGVGSVQSKQFVFDHDDDGEESTFVQAATGDASFAVGAGTTASGMYSHAEGLFTTAYGNRSHAEGDTTVARGINSHAEGEYTIARGEDQHVSGKYNIEDMDEEYAEIVGNGESTSARSNARTLDWDGNAWYAGVVSSNAYPNDIVSDDDALTTTEAVHQILDEEVPVETGTNIGASATYAGAVQTKSFTNEGHTFHQYAGAVGASAFGMECQAVAAGSFAEGYGTEAGGVYAHAEGQGTHAAGKQSHAEGIGGEAGGESSHVEGYATVTRSAAEAAHAEGIETTATSRAQHVQGRYNIVDSDGIYAHIVGNGTNTTRSNAHTLDWSGNAWYAGTVSAGTVDSPATVTNANDLTTKSYVDTALANSSGPFENGTNGIRSAKLRDFYYNSEWYRQTASGVGSFSSGSNTTASGKFSHAEGLGSTASGDASHAEGEATAQGNRSHAEGSATSIGIASHAEGYGQASGQGSHAEGTGQTGASAYASHAEGYGSQTIGRYSHAEGRSSITKGEYSHAEGWNGYSYGQYAHCEGTSGAPISITIDGGSGTEADPYTTQSSMAYLREGQLVITETGSYGWIESLSTVSRTLVIPNLVLNAGDVITVYRGAAFGYGSHAEGNETIARDSNAHAEGSTTRALGQGSHAEGSATRSVGSYSHSEGSACASYISYSHAEGNNTKTFGNGSHSEGQYGIATGSASHVEGANTSINYDYISFSANVSGNTYTTASSISSNDKLQVGCVLSSSVHGSDLYTVTAIDRTNSTVTFDAPLPDLSRNYYIFCLAATGEGSHAEGKSVAIGKGSHAEGLNCYASGHYAHAEGVGTIAKANYQHVDGHYNVADSSGTGTYVHITGIGSSESDRKNGFTINNVGNGWFAGNITANGGSLTLHDSTGDVTVTAAQLRQLLAMLS